MNVARGDLVVVAGSGDYAGKPRPALVVQADAFNAEHPSIAVCLVTSTLVDASLARIAVTPSPANGLKLPSHVMIDKVTSIRRDTIKQRVGALDPVTMMAVDQALRLWFSL